MSIQKTARDKDPLPSTETPTDPDALLAAYQRRLLEADKMARLGELVSGIAHEIHTPLGALVNNHKLFSRIIQRIEESFTGCKHLLPENEAAKLNKLFKELNNLNRVNVTASECIADIVESLRRYRREESDVPCQTTLEDILDTVLALVRHQMKNRITVKRDYRAHVSIPCFPTRLGQAFLNLFVNAAQAIEGAGEISIKTYNRTDRVVVEIADDGPGIPAEIIDKIFESGFTTKDHGHGVGIGLALVKEIILQHGGTIDVASTPGKGACFRIQLPGTCRDKPE